MNRMSTELQNPDQMQAYNSTYPKGGVYLRAASRSCSKDSFVVNGTFVLLINIGGESPALLVAANRYASCFRRNHSLETA